MREVGGDLAGWSLRSGLGHQDPLRSASVASRAEAQVSGGVGVGHVWHLASGLVLAVDHLVEVAVEHVRGVTVAGCRTHELRGVVLSGKDGGRATLLLLPKHLLLGLLGLLEG